MQRVLALTAVALAGFATAAYADNVAPTGSTSAQSRAHLVVAATMPNSVRPPDGLVTPVDLRGKGEEGKPCHADEGTNHIYIGTYKIVFNKLRCAGPAGSIDCRKDEKTDPPKSTCYDGHSKP